MKQLAEIRHTANNGTYIDEMRLRMRQGNLMIFCKRLSH